MAIRWTRAKYCYTHESTWCNGTLLQAQPLARPILHPRVRTQDPDPSTVLVLVLVNVNDTDTDTDWPWELRDGAGYVLMAALISISTLHGAGGCPQALLASVTVPDRFLYGLGNQGDVWVCGIPAWGRGRVRNT